MAAEYKGEKPGIEVNYENGILTVTRQLQFKTELGDGPGVFVGHPSIPAIGRSDPDFPGAFLTAIKLKQEKNSVEWTVTLPYSSEREMAEDPNDDPVQVSWDGENYTEAVFQDREGNAIVNSAGDYFIDPSPVKEKTHLIAKIVATVPFVPSWAFEFLNVVNSSAIVIDGLPIPAGKAFIQRPTISAEKIRNERYYREVAIDVHIHPDGWSTKPLNAGFREIDEDDNRIQIKNAGDEEEPTTPVPLDSDGHAIADPNPENVVFLEFDIYREMDFTLLPGIS